MNSSDRILNNLKVLQDHGIMIEEERDLLTRVSTFKFEINENQLASLNIKHYDEKEECLNTRISNPNCFCTMNTIDKEFGKLFDRVVKQYEENEDYKNKPYLRSNYMNSLDIVKVEVLNDRVVIMRFGDGSFTKAVCTEDDAKNGKFDVDIGITICLMKKMLGETESNKKGYAKLLRNVHKMMESQEKEAREAEQLKINAKARKVRKAQRRAAAVKQENDMFRNDISDAVLYALERLEERKSEPELEKVD